MTIDEYASQVSGEIRAAYNSRNRDAALQAIRAAKAQLAQSDISLAGQNRFWREVERQFLGGQLLIEKQEASALHQLMREIEAELAARQKDTETEK